MSEAFDHRRLTFFSLLAGSAALVPVPFLDDHLMGRARARLVREIARHRGVAIDRQAVRRLAVGPPRTLGGCLRGCLTGAVLKASFYVTKKLLRSVFRKLVYVLAVNDASDGVAITLHHGWLIDHAAGLGHLQAPDGAARVRRAIEQVVDEVDPRPLRVIIRTLLAGGRSTLARAARLLAKSVRRGGDDELDAASLDAEEALLGDLTADLEAEMRAAEGHFASLERRYDEAYRDLPPAESDASHASA